MVYEKLECRFNIVDTVTHQQLARTGLPFAEWVARRIMPTETLASSAGLSGSGTMLALTQAPHHDP